MSGLYPYSIFAFRKSTSKATAAAAVPV
ncbi:hypothetical protein DOY81_010728, partial [Sarcophaga bullata]